MASSRAGPSTGDPFMGMTDEDMARAMQMEMDMDGDMDGDIDMDLSKLGQGEQKSQAAGSATFPRPPYIKFNTKLLEPIAPVTWIGFGEGIQRAGYIGGSSSVVGKGKKAAASPKEAYNFAVHSDFDFSCFIGCRICHKSFLETSIADIARHYIEKHEIPAKKVWICPDSACRGIEIPSYDWKSFKIHLTTEHGRMAPTAYNYCDRPTSEDPARVCGYTTYSGMKRHVGIKHTPEEEKPKATCLRCYRLVVGSNSIKKHNCFVDEVGRDEVFGRISYIQAHIPPNYTRKLDLFPTSHNADNHRGTSNTGASSSRISTNSVSLALNRYHRQMTEDQIMAMAGNDRQAYRDYHVFKSLVFECGIPVEAVRYFGHSDRTISAWKGKAMAGFIVDLLARCCPWERLGNAAYADWDWDSKFFPAMQEEEIQAFESSAAQMHIRVPDLVDANRGVRSKSTSADEAERLDDIDLMLFAAVEQAVAFQYRTEPEIVRSACLRLDNVDHSDAVGFICLADTLFHLFGMKRSRVDWDTGRRPRKVWRRSIQRRYNPVAESNVYGALMSLIEGKKLTEQAGNLCLLTVGQVSRRTAAEQKDRLRALQLIREVADVPEDITLETIHLKLKQAADTAQIQNDQEDLERKPGTMWRSDNDHFRQLAQFLIGKQLTAKIIGDPAWFEGRKDIIDELLEQPIGKGRNKSKLHRYLHTHQKTIIAWMKKVQEETTVPGSS